MIGQECQAGDYEWKGAGGSGIESGVSIHSGAGADSQGQRTAVQIPATVDLVRATD
jgi:hypothetical protein